MSVRFYLNFGVRGVAVVTTQYVFSHFESYVFFIELSAKTAWRVTTEQQAQACSHAENFACKSLHLHSSFVAIVPLLSFPFNGIAWSSQVAQFGKAVSRPVKGTTSWSFQVFKDLRPTFS